jgi:hypothetical protein
MFEHSRIWNLIVWPPTTLYANDAFGAWLAARPSSDARSVLIIIIVHSAASMGIPSKVSQIHLTGDRMPADSRSSMICV